MSFEEFGALLGDAGRQWGDPAKFHFIPNLHESLLGRDDRYQSQWASLSDGERAMYEQQIADKIKSAEARAIRDHRTEEARHKNLLGSGVPMKDVTQICNIEVKSTTATEAVECFLSDERSLLVLSGTRGCGKTFAASWGCDHWCERYAVKHAVENWDRWEEPYGFGAKVGPLRYPEFLFIDVSKLTRLSRYSDKDMAKVENPRLLVIDDLGVEYLDDKGSFLSTIDGIINSRYASTKKTVITTNLPSTKFKERYGERIADRIRESGQFVEISDKSLRGSK